MRHCFVTQVGNAIEALASALDPEREPPFKGDILDLLEWAEKDVLEMRQQFAETTDLLNHARRSLKQSTVNGGSERAAWNGGVEAAQSGKKKSDCPYPYESEESDYWIDGFRDVMWQKEHFPDTDPLDNQSSGVVLCDKEPVAIGLFDYFGECHAIEHNPKAAMGPGQLGRYKKPLYCAKEQ